MPWSPPWLPVEPQEEEDCPPFTPTAQDRATQPSHPCRGPSRAHTWGSEQVCRPDRSSGLTCPWTVGCWGSCGLTVPTDITVKRRKSGAHPQNSLSLCSEDQAGPPGTRSCPASLSFGFRIGQDGPPVPGGASPSQLTDPWVRSHSSRTPSV